MGLLRVVDRNQATLCWHRVAPLLFWGEDQTALNIREWGGRRKRKAHSPVSSVGPILGIMGRKKKERKPTFCEMSRCRGSAGPQTSTPYRAKKQVFHYGAKVWVCEERCAEIVKREAAGRRADASGGAGPSRIGQDPKPVTIVHKPSPMDAAARQEKALVDHMDEEAKSQQDLQAEVRRQRELLRGLIEHADD